MGSEAKPVSTGRGATRTRMSHERHEGHEGAPGCNSSCTLVSFVEEESSSNKEPAKTRRVVLRFLKDVPAIIGADMKTYGPFSTEDVASVHIDNARILVKQGLAVLVENV